MADVRVGEAALVVGTTDMSWGYLTNLSETESVQMKETADGDGDIKAVALYGKKYEISGTYTWRSDTSAPTSQVGTGTTITVTDVAANSGAIHIISVTENYTGGLDPDFKSVDFTGIWWPDLGV